MRKILLFSLFLFSCEGASSQYWAHSYGGQTIDEGLSIATGPQGETYSTGYFTGFATFGVSSIAASGLSDVYILKTDSTGTVMWVNDEGGAGVDKGLSIDADAAGNIAVTGFYNGSALFGSQSLVSAGQQDIFLAKYDAAGNLQWAISAGGTSSDIGNCVRFDNSGNIIITGEFTGTCFFGATQITSLAGSIDVFTAKFDSNGNLLWVKTGSAIYTDRGINLAVDANDNIYVNGLFSDTITFDQVHSNTISNALFVLKYDQSGTEQWFRWLGSTAQSEAGGMDWLDNRLALSGSFTGDVYFYGNGPPVSLNGVGNNNIFLCSYDNTGNLQWSRADGSTSDFTSNDLVMSPAGNLLITGNFGCRLEAYSAAYGDGTFCSIGYSDCYVASYDSNGSFLWARNYGGPNDDFTNSLTVSSTDHISTTGLHNDSLYITCNPVGFNGGIVFNQLPMTYCGDTVYYVVSMMYSSFQSTDIFVNSGINLAREPMDFFYRTGAACTRPVPEMEICCGDTVTGCELIPVSAGIQTVFFSPVFNFQWTNGATLSYTQISSAGLQVVTATSADGCFMFSDSIYADVYPLPPKPLVNDNKGVNFFAFFPQQIDLCSPDSVILQVPNADSGTVTWTGFPPGLNPITVSSGGFYHCTVTDSNGCASYNSVPVNIDDPFSPVDPRLTCLSDLDHNDTIEICEDNYFFMFAFDTITNPMASPNDCIDDMDHISWFILINGSLTNGYTDCFSANGVLSCYLQDTGNYQYDFSGWMVRSNACGVDSFYISKSVYVIVHPSPGSGGQLNVTVSGPPAICTGDTALLVVTGGSHWLWNNGYTNDSIYIYGPGYYSVTADSVVTNMFGCSATYTGSGGISVTAPVQPTISTNPASGLICPGDSIQLVCTGTGGTFEWQGPGGILPDTTNIVYVNTPGFYYCVWKLSPACQFVTNTIQVFQAATPTSSMLPSSILCTGDSVQLVVYADPSCPIFWDPPLFTFDFIQTVYTAGTYSCQLISCNQLFVFTFDVTADSMQTSITASDTSLIFCQGDSIQLSGDTGMASWLWLPSGANTSSTYITAPGQVTLIEETMNGCHDTATINLTTQFNNLVAPVSADTAVCPGESIMLNAVCATQINWSYTPVYNNIAANGNSFQTPSLFSPVTYYLFTDSGKCKSDFDSVTVDVHPAAVAVITASDSTLSFCNGDSIVLTANAGMFTYLWLPGNQQSTSITVDSAVVVSLITTTAEGCRDSAGASISEQQNNLQPPTINDTLACEGNSLLLSAQAAGQVNWCLAPDYSTIVFSGPAYQTPPVNAEQVYYLFTDSGVCKSNFDSVVIAIAPPASAIITSSDPDLHFCDGESVVLTANSGMHQYLWLPGNEQTTSITVISTTLISLITFTVDNCKDSTGADLVMEVCPETADPVIPNIITPNNDGLNDFFPGFKDRNFIHLEVINRWGRKVFEKSNDSPGWNGMENDKPLPDGTYFFILEWQHVNGDAETTRGFVTLKN